MAAQKLQNDNPGGSVALAVLYALGMILLFVGERLIGAGKWRWLSAAGALLVLLALGVRIRRAITVTGDAQYVESLLAKLYAVGVLALLMYFVQSDLWQHVAGATLQKSSTKLAGALAALWPAVWIAGALPGLLVEMAYSVVQTARLEHGDVPAHLGLLGAIFAIPVAIAVKTAVQQTDVMGKTRAPRIELMRIRDALYSGLGLAGALVFAFSIVYVTGQRDAKVDLSYFRTAKAGEATKKLAATLDAPVEVDLFFPSPNEVKDAVIGYFAELQKASNLIQVQQYDHAIDPTKAKELGVTGNGTIVIKKGTRKQLLSVGIELEAARTQLANLDKEVNKRLMQVARPQRTVYLTYGHGERLDSPQNDTDKRGTIRDLRQLLIEQGDLVRNLGAADGLAADVPSDAALVLTIGPQKPFLPEEVAAMERYLDKGGRWLLALDPENGDMKELTQLLAVSYRPVTLADDQVYARRTYQAGDRANIATGSYSSHASVTTLSHLGMRAPMILPGSGSLEEIAAKDRPESRKNLAVEFTVRSHMATWADLNGNFQLDPPNEARRVWHLAAAVVRKRPGNQVKDETRALVLADSDALTDGVVGNPGNAYWVIDGVKWLLGDEALTGEVSSEVDVPVAHTRSQDVVWFYSTIFLAPLLALGIGSTVTRRRRKNRKEKAA